MFKRIKRAVKHSLGSFRAGEAFPSIFSLEPPSDQCTVDLFKGDWAAQLPLPGVQTGNRPDLFEDPRIQWFLDYLNPLGGVAGKSVLELGPLEGAHSTMLEKAGAGSILGIEANGRAYLKCLTVKELLGLHRCKFLYGDFVKYLDLQGPQFSLGIACGVFYHLRDPHKVLASLRKRVSGQTFLWTHYWTPRIQSEYPQLLRNFSAVRQAKLGDGSSITLHRCEYEASFFHKGFFGGNARYSEWLEKDDLFRAIRSAGWEIAAERDDSNPNGPAISCILEPAV